MDVSDTFDAKMQAWKCFGSSAETLGPAEDGKAAEARHYGTTTGSFTDQIASRARYYGSVIGVRYAEALKKSDYLPRVVSDLNML